jgi:hypothetical protein
MALESAARITSPLASTVNTFPLLVVAVANELRPRRNPDTNPVEEEIVSALPGVVVPTPILPRPITLRSNPVLVKVVFCNNAPPSCTLLIPVAVNPLLAVNNPDNDEVDNTPLIVEETTPVEVAIEKILDEITLLVATTPFTVVVNTLPESEVESELIIFVNTLCIPFTSVAKVLVVVLNVFEFTKLVELVEITPLTFEVNIKLLVVVAILSVLVVEAAINEAKDEVEITPLILVVNNPVEVA